MPNIYLTINHYNKQNNILPYKYIGSDQRDNPNYFGSNKKLKEDINSLGIQNFEKQILIKYSKIENIKLREIESLIQKFCNCAENNEFYNLTNSSQKGIIWSEEKIKQRVEKFKIAFSKKTKEEKDKQRIKTKKTLENKTEESKQKTRLKASISQSIVRKTEKWKENRSKALKGKVSGNKNGMFGSARFGELNPFYGKTHSKQFSLEQSKKAKLTHTGTKKITRN